MRKFSLSAKNATTDRRDARAEVRLMSDVQVFSAVLDRDGVQGALQFLNQRSVHRLTAVYRFDGDELVNEYVYDREDPFATLRPRVAIEDSYCVLVRDTNGRIAIANARLDERVADHPKSGPIASYVGVCIRNADGTAYGSLCHFDSRPHMFTDLDIDLLSVAGQLLRDHLAEDPVDG